MVIAWVVFIENGNFNVPHAFCPFHRSCCLSVSMNACMFNDFTRSQHYCNMGRLHYWNFFICGNSSQLPETVDRI